MHGWGLGPEGINNSGVSPGWPTASIILSSQWRARLFRKVFALPFSVGTLILYHSANPKRRTRHNGARSSGSNYAKLFLVFLV